MHPYAVEVVVEERQQELLRAARGHPQAGGGLGEWRRAAARGLMTLAVALGVPGERRAQARHAASAALDLCPEP